MKRKDIIDWDIEDYIDLFDKMQNDGDDFNDPDTIVKFLNIILRSLKQCPTCGDYHNGKNDICPNCPQNGD